MQRRPNTRNPEEELQQITRVRLPQGKEIFGIVEQRLGASRMNVRCLDGATRICRIPGRFKKNLWVRTGDVIVVEPWEHGGDTKGDVVYKYRPIQVLWLKQKGYLKKLDDFQEF